MDKKTISLRYFEKKNPMGLDKGFSAWLNEEVSIKSLLQALGFPGRAGVKGDKRVSPLVAERQQFEEGVREQFKKLKEKGLSIPVFTL